MLCPSSYALGARHNFYSGRFRASVIHRGKSGQIKPAGVRCAAGSDGGRMPRVPSPSQEEIKKAILGYNSESDSSNTPLTSNGASTQQASGANSSAASATSPAQQDQSVVLPGSWDDWKLHLESIDEMLQDIQTIDSELEDAVRQEDYKRAAKLKTRMRQLEEHDAVEAVLKDMDSALEEERYGDAAMLRDKGGAGLMGWWAGRGEDDPTGHIIRVSPGFGRYVAEAFTARELAELTGWSREVSIREMLLGGGSDSLQQLAGGSAEDVGMPVFELCVRRSPQTGQLEQQAVALFAPVDLQSMGSSGQSLSTVIAEGLDGKVVMIEQDESGEVLSVSVEMEEDDSSDDDSGDDDSQRWRSEVRELLSGPDQVVSIDQLAGFFPSAQDPLNLGQAGDEEEDDSDSEDDVQQQISDALQEEEAAAEEAARRDSAQREMDPMAEIDRILARINSSRSGDPGASSSSGSRSGGGGDNPGASLNERLARMLQSGAAQDGDDGSDDLGEGLRYASVMLQRAPAEIEWHGRDSFTVRATAPPAAPPAGGAAAPASKQLLDRQHLEAAASLAGVSPPGVEEGEREGRGSAAAPSPNSSGSSSNDTAVRQRGQGAAEGSSAAAASSSSSSETSPGSEGGPEREGEAGSERLQRLEAEVQQWAARRGARKEQVDAIMRATLTAASAGEDASEAEQQAQHAVGLEGACTYTRIPTEHFARTDPFSGLYLGAFGPHGPEVLQLSRVVEEGEECVHATKVTGDRNVPAGEVSFRARIGRQHRLGSSESYPAELGVKARYKGQGRVAQEGFVNPKWVEGELLVLAAGNPLAHGAELGFVYHMDGVKRFLLLFSRIDLRDLEEKL